MMVWKKIFSAEKAVLFLLINHFGKYFLDSGILIISIKPKSQEANRNGVLRKPHWKDPNVPRSSNFKF